jgi:hypothetical protein
LAQVREDAEVAAQEHAARRIDPPTAGYFERVEVLTARASTSGADVLD